MSVRGPAQAPARHSTLLTFLHHAALAAPKGPPPGRIALVFVIGLLLHTEEGHSLPTFVGSRSLVLLADLAADRQLAGHLRPAPALLTAAAPGCGAEALLHSVQGRSPKPLVGRTHGTTSADTGRTGLVRGRGRRAGPRGLRPGGGACRGGHRQDALEVDGADVGTLQRGAPGLAGPCLAVHGQECSRIGPNVCDTPEVQHTAIATIGVLTPAMACAGDGVDGCEDRAAGVDLKAIQAVDQRAVASIAVQAPALCRATAVHGQEGIVVAVHLRDGSEVHTTTVTPPGEIAPALSTARPPGQKCGRRGVDLHLSREVNATAVGTTAAPAATPTLAQATVLVYGHEGPAVGVDLGDARQGHRAAIASIGVAAPAADAARRAVEGDEGARGGDELRDGPQRAGASGQVGGLAVASIGAGTPALQGAVRAVGRIGVLVAGDLRHLAEVNRATGATVGATAPANASLSHGVEG